MSVQLRLLTDEAACCCSAERSVAAAPARGYSVESPCASAAERPGAAATWRIGPLLLLLIAADARPSGPLPPLLPGEAACRGCGVM